MATTGARLATMPRGGFGVDRQDFEQRQPHGLTTALGMATELAREHFEFAPREPLGPTPIDQGRVLAQKDWAGPDASPTRRPKNDKIGHGFPSG